MKSKNKNGKNYFTHTKFELHPKTIMIIFDVANEFKIIDNRPPDYLEDQA